MNTIDGIPINWDNDQENTLFGSLFPSNMNAPNSQSTTSFESLKTNKNFEEITYENKFGTIDKCASYTNAFYKGSIDANELIANLRMNNTYKQFFFYYQRYLLKSFNNYSGISPTVIASVSSGSSYENNPFTYNDENGKVVYANLNIALNERACYVNVNNPGFVFNINDNEIKYAIRFTYQDALNQRIDNKNTKETNDFTIEDQYEAIIITTASATDLLALADQIGHRTFIQTELKGLFVEKLRKANTGSVLKFLYENMPDFVLKELLSEFKPEELWKHVELLTDYDDKGLFSGWVDGSSALINVFKAFGSSYYLVSKFRKDPAFLKRIFKNLDGDSLVDNQIVSNRLAFASLINACMAANIEYKDKKVVLEKKFYNGNGYSIDSDISSNYSDEKDDEFFLKQRKTVTSTGTAINANDFSEEEYQSETTVDAEEGQMYHPLDMVTLVDYSLGSPIRVQVPVIFVKALASEAEWKDVNRNIRIGFDFLAIMLGLVITFTTANPGALALALADIALATGDVAVQDAAKELEKTPEGREFLETWEKIYMVGGVLLAGPALIETVMLKGTRLLNLAKTATSAKFLKTCLLKVLLEIEIANFTKNTVKEIIFGEEALSVSSISFNFAGVTRLQEQGVLFIKGIGFDDKVVGYAAIYKGEAIASGTAKEVREALKDLWAVGGVKLIKFLDELPIIRFYKGITYTVFKTENEIKWVIKNSKLNNRARLFDGMLEFDLDTLGATKNLGQRFTSEAFEFFNKNIKSVKAEWRTNPKYPEGSSLGYKEFTKALIEFNGNKIKAVKETTFYKTMSLYEFNKVDDVLDFSEKGGNIIVLLKK